jgi:hypothetical protein
MQKLTRQHRTQSRFFVHRRTRWVYDIIDIATEKIIAIAMGMTSVVALTSIIQSCATAAAKKQSVMSAQTSVWSVGLNKKRSTIFCDIDGTLLEYRPFGTYTDSPPVALDSVIEKLSGWKDDGHVIILTTARPEELRELTIEEMHVCGIPWDQLVMGIGRGPRYLINDESASRPGSRAFAFTVPRDEGLVNVALWSSRLLSECKNEVS